MKTKLFLISIWSALFVGVVVAVCVLVAYWYYLGPISRKATDWGSFGSVMGGVFTLLSSVATIGTLLFFYIQQLETQKQLKKKNSKDQKNQKRHDAVVEKQLSALTFEQYFNHRKVFIENLEWISDFYKRTIEFTDPGKLYSNIYYMNNPCNCEYRVLIEGGGEEKEGGLIDLVNIYSSIEKMISSPKKVSCMSSLVFNFAQMQRKLGMEYKFENQDGDVIYCGRNIGLNIYNMASCLDRIERTLNDILFYSGNKKINSIIHKSLDVEVIDCLYSMKSNKRLLGNLDIFHKDELIPSLYELYQISRETDISGRLLFELQSKLSSIFLDRENFDCFVRENPYDEFKNIARQDVDIAYEFLKINSNESEKIKRLVSSANDLTERALRCLNKRRQN